MTECREWHDLSLLEMCADAELLLQQESMNRARPRSIKLTARLKMDSHVHAPASLARETQPCAAANGG